MCPSPGTLEGFRPNSAIATSCDVTILPWHRCCSGIVACSNDERGGTNTQGIVVRSLVFSAPSLPRTRADCQVPILKGPKWLAHADL